MISLSLDPCRADLTQLGTRRIAPELAVVVLRSVAVVTAVAVGVLVLRWDQKC